MGDRASEKSGPTADEKNREEQCQQQADKSNHSRKEWTHSGRKCIANLQVTSTKRSGDDEVTHAPRRAPENKINFRQ